MHLNCASDCQKSIIRETQGVRHLSRKRRLSRSYSISSNNISTYRHVAECSVLLIYIFNVLLLKAYLICGTCTWRPLHRFLKTYDHTQIISNGYIYYNLVGSSFYGNSSSILWSIQQYVFSINLRETATFQNVYQRMKDSENAFPILT